MALTRVQANMDGAGSRYSVGSFASLTAAVAALGATECTVVIDKSTSITGTTTIPTTMTLEKTRAGVITGAYSLVINGGMAGDLTSQWFDGPTVTGLKLVRPQMFGSDSAALGSAIVAASGGKLLFSAGTYALASAVSKTLTGDSHWVAEGPVILQYTGSATTLAIQIEVDSFDLTIDGPIVVDANTHAGTGLRINNDTGITNMDEAADLYMTNVKAINSYSDTNSRNAIGIYAYGAFNTIKLDKCGAVDINRQAALTGSPASIGIGYGHGGILKYARNIVITDPYIDNVTAADAVGDGTYVDMDGLNITGPAANANGGVKMDTTLIVRGGTFINCQGRSIKSQMESNLVDGPTFIRNSDGKKAMASGSEVDFQHGSGILTNFKVKYGLVAGGLTPFPVSWGICNATVRGFATEEGALIVSNGEIQNDVAQGTDLLPYFVTVVNSAGQFQSVIVENNSFLGAGGISEVINVSAGTIDSIVANNNYLNDLETSLVYSSVDYSSATVIANGNFLSGTARNVTDGGSVVPSWFGDRNVGFSTIWNGNVKRALASTTDGAVITHYLGGTPTGVIVTGSIASESVSVTALAATTFTVAIKKDDGSAGTSQTIYYNAWR